MSIVITVSCKKIYKGKKINFCPDRLIMSKLGDYEFVSNFLHVPNIQIGFNKLSYLTM